MERRGLNIRKAILSSCLPAFRLLPLPVASRMVSGIGRLEYQLRRSVRASFDEAVSHGREILHGEWDVPAVSRELAGNHILWRARDLLLDGVTDDKALGMFRVEGREHLDAALRQKRGCIVLANHFGAHLLPAHWLCREDYPIRFYMERPRHISRYMARRFEVEGPVSQEKLFISRNGAPADSAGSILRACKALRAECMLYIAGDVRWTGKLTHPTRFLGQRFRFSTTWLVLASMTQAPVVMVFCRMNEDGRYTIDFHPAFQVPENAPQDPEPWTRKFLDILEEQIRRFPTNSNEYFFWDKASGQVA